jgi:hypothetical protein
MRDEPSGPAARPRRGNRSARAGDVGAGAGATARSSGAFAGSAGAGSSGAAATSARGAALAARVREAGAALIATVERIESARWGEVPAPGVWSVGREAEHVVEGALYHQWIVRFTVGQAAASRRPSLERAQLAPRQTLPEVVELLHRRTAEGAALVEGLTDAQLDLPTRPPRARAQTLADTIERVMVGHVQTHRSEIETRLGGRGAGAPGVEARAPSDS